MVIVPDDGDGGWLRAVGGGPVVRVPDVAARVAEIERAEGPRWVVGDLTRVYPRLLRRGVRLGRCHDVTLTETLLLGYDGRYGERPDPWAAHARARGLPLPPLERETPQGTLFDDDRPVRDGAAEAAMLDEVHAGQVARMAALGRMGTLAAAESAGGLVAAEMGFHGLPFSREVHDSLLTAMLGPRPVKGLRPRKLQELADRVSAGFGRPVNPDSPQQLVAAFKSAGTPVESTRSWVIKKLDHPAVEPLLEYKELARVWTAHGWVWADQWVQDGRFRPEYVVGGVVSGRWATNGGAALQIPKAVRGAVRADPGHLLVVADAAQLEPRVLAAMSGDTGMARAAGEIDLYEALSGTFGGARDGAKIALLSAMYGGGSPEAMTLLAVMRQRFPAAYAYVEGAAQAGERGRLVRSWLGRTCPPASSSFKSMGAGPEASRAVRDRGRFTRNFVVQGTAAEWALALLAFLRNRLREESLGDLVFFQHDEVIVHCPADHAPRVAEVIAESGRAATELLFPGTPVRIPLEAVAVESYADAK